jgi:viroplasmin and RNaseH domain-containing protein
MGMLFGMPVVQVYEDYEKMILWNFGDEDSKPIKKQLKEK